MKEYDLTVGTFKCHNDAEKAERDDMVYYTFMGLIAAHRRGVYSTKMRVRLSFYDWRYMQRAMDEMECDGTLALMKHTFGCTRVLCIDLEPDNWGMFRKP